MKTSRAAVLREKIGDIWDEFRQMANEARDGDMGAMFILALMVILAPVYLVFSPILLVILLFGWALGQVFGEGG